MGKRVKRGQVMEGNGEMEVVEGNRGEEGGS